MITFLQQYKNTYKQTFILSINIKPKYKKQNKKLIK